MQTFLPFYSFTQSLACLDNKRLGKQRVEAMQILNVLNPKYKKKGWRNHPAVKMWRGYENALRLYHNIAIDLWRERGFKNTMRKRPIRGTIIMPDWFGNKAFHDSHKSNLVRKMPEHYHKYFPNIPDNLSYVWNN